MEVTDVPDELPVDPKRLLRVSFADALGQEHELVVALCAYAAVHDEGGVGVVALYICWDPVDQAPEAPYRCPRARLGSRFLDPRTVTIRPYLPKIE